jgi:hypothetical protein
MNMCFGVKELEMVKPAGLGNLLDELMGKERDVPVHLVSVTIHIPIHVSRFNVARCKDCLTC